MSEQDKTSRDRPAPPRLAHAVVALEAEVSESEIERAARVSSRRPSPEAFAAARRLTTRGR